VIQIKIRAKINPVSGPICKDSIHGRYAEPNATDNAIGYAKFRSRSHDVVIRVYDDVGNVIDTQEHKGDFKEW
jgi:hypothetical protein